MVKEHKNIKVRTLTVQKKYFDVIFLVSKRVF